MSEVLAPPINTVFLLLLWLLLTDNNEAKYYLHLSALRHSPDVLLYGCVALAVSLDKYQFKLHCD